jgi:hypothetical protein
MSKVATGGAGGAQRPVVRINEPKKTSVRDARARSAAEAF